MPDSNVMKTNHPLADDDDGDTNNKKAEFSILCCAQKTVHIHMHCLITQPHTSPECRVVYLARSGGEWQRQVAILLLTIIRIGAALDHPHSPPLEFLPLCPPGRRR